jgi:hypothetical protein
MCERLGWARTRSYKSEAMAGMGGLRSIRFWMPRPVNRHSPIGRDWPLSTGPLLVGIEANGEH